jgi:hypothetical protein
MCVNKTVEIIRRIRERINQNRDGVIRSRVSPKNPKEEEGRRENQSKRSSCHVYKIYIYSLAHNKFERNSNICPKEKFTHNKEEERHIFFFQTKEKYQTMV